MEISLPQNTKSFSALLEAVDVTTGRGGVIDTGVISSIAIYYCRDGGTPQAISLVELSAIDDAWTEGGILAYDAAGSSGAHRLDIPDAALAAGASFVNIFGQDDEIDLIPLRINLDQRIEAVFSGTPTTTSGVLNLTEATDDHFVGRTLLFRGGALDGQVSRITQYFGSTKMVTYPTLTEAPVAGQKVIIY